MSNFRYYVIQDGAVTGYADWESAAEHYIAAQGAAEIAEVVPVKLMLVPELTERGKPRPKTDRSALARQRLLNGDPPIRICEDLGLSRQAVYNIRIALVDKGLLQPLRDNGRKL